VGIFVFGCVDANTVFPVCIYRFQNGWDFKGMADSFDSGFPIGAKAPCWHTTLQCISLVCYTFCDRCPRKGDAALLSIPFPVTAEQADFASLREGKFWIRLCEIRLFVCRWCGAAERISMKILVAEQHNRGEQNGISHPVPPQRRIFRYLSKTILSFLGRSFPPVLKILSITFLA